MRSAPRRSPFAAADERGGIVIGWLTKLTVVLALFGIVMFDAISVGSTMTTVSDQGSYAALEASATWDETKDVQATFTTAVQAALEQDSANVVTPKGFRIDPDGTVHVRIHRTAHTLLLFRWSKTAKWAEVTRDARGRSVAS
jgi:hypothetical protein